MSTGNGQNFGSNMGSMPGRQQQNWTPSYGGSQAYQGAYNNMAQGLQQMPQFGPMQGPFGRSRPGNIMPPMGGGGGMPGTPGWPGFGPRGGGRDYVEWGPDAQMPGYQNPTGGMSPMEGMNPGMNKPLQVPENSGLHPMQQQQMQQFQGFPMNYANVAGFDPSRFR